MKLDREHGRSQALESMKMTECNYGLLATYEGEQVPGKKASVAVTFLVHLSVMPVDLNEICVHNLLKMLIIPSDVILSLQIRYYYTNTSIF